MNEAKKADLIASLRSSADQALESLRALPSEAFEQGRYESGWNGRQILAHIASIEWTYPRLIDVARRAEPSLAPAPADLRRTSPEEAKGIASRAPQGGIDDYNARQVEKRANATVAELIAEFETNRAATIAAVEVTDESLLRTPIRSAGGITGPLTDVIFTIAVTHVAAHVRDITGKQAAALS